MLLCCTKHFSTEIVYIQSRVESNPNDEIRKETDTTSRQEFHSVSVSLWVSAGSKKESVFLAKASFKSLRNNLDNCYHHNPHVRGFIYSKAGGKLMMCCPVV